MEDRIEKVDKVKLFKFLDLISFNLKNNTLGKYHLSRQSTDNGMILRIELHESQKIIKIDCNLESKVINLSITDVHQHVIYGRDYYNFATLYADNSINCKNFLEEIKSEEIKIDKLLDEILKDLDKFDKPVKVENKKRKYFWQK